VLGSGLDGVERKLDPGEGNTTNLYTTSLEEVEKRGIKSLPAHLLDACAHLRQDAVLRDWFGNTGTEDYVDYFSKTKVDEFNAYHSEVSQWEVDRYLTNF
jgi:glutamine synthetase